MFTSLMPDLLGVHATPLETVELAARQGFVGADLRGEALLALSDAAIAILRERFAQTSVRPGHLTLPPNRIPVGDEEWDAALLRWPRALQIARELGFNRLALVLLPFHESLNREAALEQHVQRMHQIAPLLRDNEMRLGLEYIAAPSRRAPYDTHTVWNLAGMLEILAQVDCPNIGLLLDTFHWHGAGENVADLEALTNDQIVVVHVNDAPDVPLDQHLVMERALPGATNVIDSAGFFSALHKIGYDGPVTCEPGQSAIDALSVSTDKVLEAVRRAMDEVLPVK